MELLTQIYCFHFFSIIYLKYI